MVFIAACTPSVSIPIPTTTPTVFIALTQLLTPTLTTTAIPEITETAIPTIKPPDQILSSPNGEFTAKFDNAFSHPAYQKQVIEILDKQGSLLWEIPYQHETEMVEPHPGLEIYSWSKDSKYLYFYYQYSPDGGVRAFWWTGFDLQRIDVQTGEIEQLIQGERKGFVAFAFSPDETQIAYTRAQDNPSIIFVRDLVTGIEKTAYVIFASKDYEKVGDIRWSPSGNEIAFQTETADYVAQTIYLDLSTMKQKVIKEYKVERAFFQGWSDDGKLEFLEFEKGARVILINPKNFEIMVVGTPTPLP